MFITANGPCFHQLLPHTPYPSFPACQNPTAGPRPHALILGLCLETWAVAQCAVGGRRECFEHPPALAPRAAGSSPRWTTRDRDNTRHSTFLSAPVLQELGWGGPTCGTLARPVPFCSAGSPEATRHGLMASGICHLIQSTFHQCHPRSATGAARLITPVQWGGGLRSPLSIGPAACPHHPPPPALLHGRR